MHLMYVGINVSITSVKPDIILKSTSELDFKKIKQAFEKR